MKFNLVKTYFSEKNQNELKSRFRFIQIVKVKMENQKEIEKMEEEKIRKIEELAATVN
jgi:hypothetical protein